MGLVTRALLVTAIVFLFLAAFTQAQTDYTIYFRNGNLLPQSMTRAAAGAASAVGGSHIFIQLQGPLTESEKEQLDSRGIHLLEYVPNFTWVAKVDRNLEQSDIDAGGIRWFSRISPEQKLSRLITSGIRDFARRGGDKVQFVVMLQKDEDASTWAERFRNQYDAAIIGIEPSANIIDLVASESAYSLMAETDAVLWIETAKPKPQEENNSSRDNIGATTVQAAPYNLDGLGIVVAEWDGGFAYAGHQDFGGRVTQLGTATVRDHATHVAGTIMGDGSRSSGTYRGMAPAAELLSQLWWSSASEAASEYTEVEVMGARVSSNSWGYGVGDPATQSACEDMMGNYFSENTTLDNLVRGSGGQPISIVWSAGNERSTSTQYCGSLGWTYGTISALATAKNIITVGAINSNNSSMTSFSSWGPTDDGRVKPDVVGPGCQSNSDYGVTSCSASGSYITMCGTSMSAPAVSGVVALMIQQRRNVFGYGNDVLPSTIKGILVNTAADLGQVGPDYVYGHGKVDAVKACTKIGIGDPSYAQGQISTSGVNQYDLTVPSGKPSLKVTLVWDDPGGTAMAGKDLRNDLDLVLVDPFGVEQNAWVLNPSNPGAAATKGLNRRDNVETAEVTNPAPGLWKARVIGYDVPIGPQKYSIVLTPDSINTPGQSLAWAVFDGSDFAVPPGQTSNAAFWISNVGGQTDSARVVVTDSAGWLLSNLDTVVVLGRYDSAHIVVPIQVPAGLVAGVSDSVLCRVKSRTDTMITSTNRIRVSAAAVYSISVTPPVDTSVSSPASVSFYVSVQNNSNATNNVTVTPTNSAGWTITPSSRLLNLGIGATGNTSFALLVPADVPHLTVDQITLLGAGNGGVSDTAHFAVTILNPVAAPSLVSPDTVIYTKARSFTFAWSGVADSFRLTIAHDSALLSPALSYGGLTSSGFAMPGLDSLPDGLYYWGVRGYVGPDSSSFQQFPRRICVDNGNPASPTHISPANNAILKQRTVTLVYSTPTPPTSTEAPVFTRIRIASDSGLTTNLRTFDSVLVTSFPVPGTLAEGRWYWQVQRVDLAGNISQIPVRPSFVVDSTPPNIPTELSPVDSQVVTVGPVVLRWTAGAPPAWETSKEYYYLHISKNSSFTDYSFTGYVYPDSFVVEPPLLVDGQRYYWRLKALDSAGFYTVYSAGRNFLYQTFLCGDVNSSHTGPDLSDLSMLVAYLTGMPITPPPVQTASLDCNGIVDLTDLSILVAYLTSIPVNLCCPH
ncbi:hypothetical protein C3F09_09005 [candidate division GN15 bacterium]|uniref:Peptidase S8/S53 domain-containing protein n=1 Tax=candidate division GN15 bacterium TaxID=2072418 RepID=A0A855X2B0_9BACT|nr:MAG: hypothetical protein C3F09_09005 [candidate division GN15 bacterium]